MALTRVLSDCEDGLFGCGCVVFVDMGAGRCFKCVFGLIGCC